VNRPDYLHFDLDPGSATWEQVLESSRIVHDALTTLEMPAVAKTTGSKGIHLFVPIVRGPLQKDVWTFAKALAQELAGRHRALMTSEYRVAQRPKGRVLLDYNQNAWGRTLASVYSVRPHPRACVSTPVTWKEVDAGVGIEDFRIDNVRDRFKKTGDLFKPLLRKSGRVDLKKYL
jgi:bifunctional non-homologous end joining protein LigD